MGTIMDKIRFLKAKRNFDKALTLLNDVLDQDPNIPEALYLKHMCSGRVSRTPGVPNAASGESWS